MLHKWTCNIKLPEDVVFYSRSVLMYFRMTQRLLLQIEKSELKDLIVFFVSQHNSNYLRSFPCPQYTLKRQKGEILLFCLWSAVTEKYIFLFSVFLSCKWLEVVYHLQCNTTTFWIAF